LRTSLVIATRGSKLALWQSEFIKAQLQERYPKLEVSLKIIITSGDKILDKALSKIGGKGLFLKELEEAMLRGEAQIAVHSLKDVPTQMPQGLTLGAITKREAVSDAMLSMEFESIDALPEGATVGTSSLRRKMQLLMVRPDLNIIDLRGNVDTRIRKLKEKMYDAIILASAGINRLELRDSVTHVYDIPVTMMVPSMGQAALGIEAVDDAEVLGMVKSLEDEEATIETTIEREFVDCLDGGCHVPIGVNACVQKDEVEISAVLGLPDASEVMIEKMRIKTTDVKNIGTTLANKMIEKGAKRVLAQAMEFE